jgi:hypothetical protein
MNNFVEVQLDVLAGSVEGVNRIEQAFQQPCEELLAWAVSRENNSKEDNAKRLTAIVGFTPVVNLGHTDPALNKARRFANAFQERSWGLVWRHVYHLSKAFPEAFSCGEYWDTCLNYFGRVVIHEGQIVRNIHLGTPLSRGLEQTLLNIFPPYLVPDYVEADSLRSMTPVLSKALRRRPKARGTSNANCPLTSVGDVRAATRPYLPLGPAGVNHE